MALVSRNGSTGRFSVVASGSGSPATIRESKSGKVLDLKGYGALSGQYVVRAGVDLSKPISAQAARSKPRNKATAAAKPS